MSYSPSAALPEKRFKFYGDGGTYLGILIVNVILTALTLGLYFPWAMVKELRYLYQETEFEGKNFEFHGSGKEIFIGFIKAFGAILVLLLVYYLVSRYVNQFLGFLIYIGALAYGIPMAFVNELKYTYSKSTLNGIRFGYRGTVEGMLKIYIPGFLLSIVTLGLYLPWFITSLNKEIMENTRYGDVTFKYEGSGGTLFGKMLIGTLLSIVTLFIYYSWYMADIIKYIYSCCSVELKEKRGYFKSEINGTNFFILNLTNALLVIFTLGLGTPWAIIRTHRFLLNNLVLETDIELSEVSQTESDYNDASGLGFDQIMTNS